MSIFGEARREMALFDGKVSAKTAKRLEEVGSDLLEALEELRSWIANWDCPFDDDQEYQGVPSRVDAAIAKAKGEA